MATTTLGADSAHVTPTPAAGASPGALAAFLLAQPRESLEALTEALIAAQDLQDAPHVEDVPDFRLRSDGLPGDPADHEPGGDEEAGAYAEWLSKTPAQRKASAELAPSGAFGGDHEDDELAGDETDGNCAEDEEAASHRLYGRGPGCIVSDPDKCNAADDSMERWP